MNSTFFLFSLPIILLLFSGCSQNHEATKKASADFLDKNKSQSGVTTTESGLQYKVITKGEGELNKKGDMIRANYTLKSIDGTVHDSGKDMSISPEGQREGIKELLYLMKVGDKFEAAIPAELAYGSTGYSTIKPYEALIYEVEILINQQKQFLVDNAKKEGVKTTASGLQYKVIKSGSGISPKLNDDVECHYRGTLINGKEFDSSYKRGTTASFKPSGVIKGWTEALQLMKEGDKWELYIPADLAYGNQAPPAIGPGKTLIFTLEMVKVTPEKKDDK